MNRRIRNQSTVSFTLSFLDVLCCGLGSAILLLMVIKHGPVTDPIEDEHSVAPVDIDAFQEQISSSMELEKRLSLEVTQQLQEIKRETEASLSRSSDNDSQLQAFVDLVSQLQEQKEALEQTKTELTEVRAANNLDKGGEKRSTGKHLTGLKINNDRVLILLDASASMLSTSLVEIIRLRASSLAVQQQASKWRSARGAAMWIYEQIEDQGRFQLFTYNDSVFDIRSNQPTRSTPSSWVKKDDPSITATYIRSTLANRKALGPTDLKSALNAISFIRPSPSQVIVITDGLPTLPGTTALNRVRGCHRPNPNSTVLLTPHCRLGVMQNATTTFHRNTKNIRVDVILYPLEGDANAVLPYWKLADSTGGRLLSPLPGWPST